MTSGFNETGRPGSRNRQYMIAPAAIGLSEQQLVDRLNRIAGIEVARTYPARGVECPPIAIVAAPDDKIAALRRSSGDMFVIEPDSALRAAAFAGFGPQIGPQIRFQSGLQSRAMMAMNALGPGLTVTLQVQSQSGQPVQNAEVQLVGEQWATQGLTDNSGQISLSLYGELPETITELLIKPRANCWGFSRRRPQLRTDGINTIVLQPLLPHDDLGWSGKAMRFDRLPAECRGAGSKIVLIDSGVATSQPQLAGITHGIALRSDNASPWAQDVMGHGTPCAGIIGAVPRGANTIRGCAPDAELHVCKLPLDARCSDLVGALDYCLQNGIDVVCLGFACQRASAIVEQRIIVAKQQGVAVIAAAGNTAGPVQFPACSPHVIAAGAIGQIGTYPLDSSHATHAAAADMLPGGLFIPAFSCRGPELDLCAPGVAVVSCQAPDGYAAGDGTSLATAYITALAALVLAHHADFRRDFAGRDWRRVERLFQILKDTARPIGHPWQTGAGLPDAVSCLGLAAQPGAQSLAQSWSQPSPAAGLSIDGALEEMRQAIRHMDVAPSELAQFTEDVVPTFQPPRGPALVARLPLNPFPAVTPPEGGTDADVQALKAAMNFAGLASGTQAPMAPGGVA
jgi:hypothetical protein